MPTFKKASWDSDKLTLAKQELDDIFYSVVRNDNGSYNRRSVEKIEEARFDIAELIIKVIEETYAVTDPTPWLVDVEEGNLGDKKIFQILNSSLRVVNRSPGSKPLSQRIDYKEFMITTSQREVNVEIPLEKVAVGRITPSAVAEQMAASILRDQISTVLSAIDSAVDAVADRTGETNFNLRYTGYTQANFDKAIDGVLDENESPTVFGRHVALAPAIRAFTGFGQVNLQELTERGLIGQYHGAKIVTVQDQFNKVTGSHVMAKDRVFVAGGTKGAIMRKIDVSFLDYATVDPRSATFMTGRRLEYGVLVWDKYRYRVVTQ
jgi:hypothetical protein